MDIAQLISIAPQLSIVIIFIYYSLELQKRYQKSQELRDKEFITALNKLTSAIECLESQITYKLKTPPRKPIPKTQD